MIRTAPGRTPARRCRPEADNHARNNYRFRFVSELHICPVTKEATRAVNSRNIFIAALTILAAGAVQSRDYDREKKIIPADGAQRVSLDLNFGVGHLTISPGSGPDVAQIDLDRDISRVRESFESETRGGTSYVTLESRPRKSIHNLDSEHNDWDLLLSNRYSTEARLELGACEADIELGGVPLTELTLETGASGTTVSFSEPNPKRMRELKVEAGASSVKLLDLGNARFDIMTFEGGAGSFDLDFRGQYEGESEISVEVGVASADIILPEGVAVRIETDEDNWFSSVDIQKRKLSRVEDGVYESKDYDQAKDRILLKIEVGLGSVDVRWKP
jgi:hypothetical protein